MVEARWWGGFLVLRPRGFLVAHLRGCVTASPARNRQRGALDRCGAGRACGGSVRSSPVRARGRDTPSGPEPPDILGGSATDSYVA
jgi:hypothetical protein